MVNHSPSLQEVKVLWTANKLVQLSAWCANVDTQYYVSLHKLVEYVTKYASKSEPFSNPLAVVYSTTVRSLITDSTSLKAVHKLLINSVGRWDYSVQDTCHLLLQLPMVSSCDFIVLNLEQWIIVYMKSNLPQLHQL